MIKNIQCLRAFAAINVVLYHVIGTSSNYARGVDFLRVFEGWGTCGVDIFFVISGFVMLHTQMRSRSTPLHFLQHRIIRLAPIYWLLTLFVVTLFHYFPGLFRLVPVTPAWLACSLLFTSTFALGKLPVVYVGWTLEWEMLFYLTFACALLVKSWRGLILAVGVLLAGVVLATRDLILLDFFLGVLLAYAFHHRQFGHKTAFAVLAAGSCALLASLAPTAELHGLHRFIVWGLPSFLIVCGAVYAPQTRNTVLAFLGDASYSIYLVQMLTIPAFYKVSSKLLAGVNNDLLAIACVAASTLFGCLVFTMLERPLTERLRRRLGRAAPVRQIA